LNVLDVQLLRAVDCNTDHYLSVAERFNLKEINEIDGKEKYCFEVSNRLQH
jgi:hypothetical protein